MRLDNFREAHGEKRIFRIDARGKRITLLMRDHMQKILQRENSHAVCAKELPVSAIDVPIESEPERLGASIRFPIYPYKRTSAQTSREVVFVPKAGLLGIVRQARVHHYYAVGPQARKAPRGQAALNGAALRISYGLLCRHLHRNIGHG
jgi:hypothetical protein